MYKFENYIMYNVVYIDKYSYQDKLIWFFGDNKVLKIQYCDMNMILLWLMWCFFLKFFKSVD